MKNNSKIQPNFSKTIHNRLSAELVLANKEKTKRAAELVIAKKEIVIVKKASVEKQDQLHQLNYQLNRAQRTAKIGSWSWDSIQDKIVWSKELYHIYGLDDHLPAPNYAEHLKLYSVDSRKILDSAVKIALKAGKPYEVELQLLDTSRGNTWVIGKGEVVRNTKGKVIGQRGTVQDITKRKNLEDEVLHSADLIHSLIDSIPDLIFYKDLHGVYLGCNPAFAEFVGHPKDKIIGKTDYNLFPKNIADSFRENDKKMLRLSKARRNEEWVTYPNGEKRLLDTLKVPYGEQGNTKIGILGISRDSTERKKLEDEISHNLEQQKFLSEISVELNQYTSFNVVLNSIIQKLATFTHAGRSYIFEDSVDGKSTSNIFEWCAKGVKPQIDTLKNIPYSAIPSFLKAFNEKGMLKCDDVSTISKDVRDILEPQGIKSILLLPLFVGNRRLGFFGLDIVDKKRNWKTEEVQLLNIISHSIASVFGRREVDHLKSEFISIASHQLKTPLIGIKWLSELMLGNKVGKPSAMQQEYLQDIHLSNERMLKLVDDLLDISHIETGNKFTVMKKRTDIVEIVDQVLMDNQLFAKEKEIHIIQCEGAPKKFFVNIDGNKIRQVFENLITNAIKYSKYKGFVEVGCEHKNGEIIFSVKDNGIGIPREQQKNMFEKFFRADNARQYEPDGTGLGLYIAKAVVEAHGGKLWFESGTRKGTVFYFSLQQ
ncbi:MAG: ATP-binding protein [Candidatus Peregrinibacteria bacterium]